MFTSEKIGIGIGMQFSLGRGGGGKIDLLELLSNKIIVTMYKGNIPSFYKLALMCL